MCPVFSRLKKGISSVLHWCLTGVSLVSQREVNGKSTSECGEFVTDLYWTCNGLTNETPKRVYCNTGESVVSEIRKKRSRSETAMSRNQTKITFWCVLQ